ITDLGTAQAESELLERLVRCRWKVEALHYLCNTAFREDSSRARCGHAPQNMAMLRNPAIPGPGPAGRLPVGQPGDPLSLLPRVHPSTRAHLAFLSSTHLTTTRLCVARATRHI